MNLLFSYLMSRSIYVILIALLPSYESLQGDLGFILTKLMHRRCEKL